MHIHRGGCTQWRRWDSWVLDCTACWGPVSCMYIPSEGCTTALYIQFMLRSGTGTGFIQSIIIFLKISMYKVHSRSMNYSLSCTMPPTTLVASQEKGSCQECQHHPERHGYRWWKERHKLHRSCCYGYRYTSSPLLHLWINYKFNELQRKNGKTFAIQ